jgi:drug/metabolite transporter (DMT)-like permease
MTGLAWMAVAQLFFAAMHVCTRLGAQQLPWSEVAAARFLVGAAMAILVARQRRSDLRVRNQGRLSAPPLRSLWRCCRGRCSLNR